MAEGSFSGNSESNSIDQIMLNGFTGMLNAITEQNKTITKLTDTLSDYTTMSEKRHAESIKVNKSIASRLTKEYNLIQKETNPLLVTMVSALTGLNNATGAPISTPVGDTIQIIKWEDSQFSEFMKTVNSSESQNSINSMESLFSTIIRGMNDMNNQNQSGSGIGGLFSSIFNPSFDGQAKKFTKAYTTVINGIVNSLIKIEKHSPALEKASTTLINTLTNIEKATKNMLAPQKLKSLAGGIAMLGLSLVGFAMVSPAVLVVVGALTLLKGITFTMARTTAKDMLKVAAAMALFGLSIWAFSEVVTAESLLKTAAALLLLGLAIKGFTWAVGTGMGNNGLKTLLLTTISVAALGIALQTYNDVEWESMAKGAVALTGMAGAMWIVSKVPDAAVGAASLLLGAVALGAIGLALKLFPENTDMLLPVGLFVAGFGTTLALAGTVAPFIAAGAAVMLIGGAALITIAAGLAIINATSFDKSKIIDFTESLKYMFLNVGTMEMAKAGAIAAVAMTPMFIATTMATGMAMGLSLISYLPYDVQGAVRMGEAAKAFFSVMGTPDMMVRATIATLAAVPMLAATTMGTVIGLELALLSNLSYDVNKINEFGASMSALTQTYVNTVTEIGFIGSAKLLAGVGIATTMAVATPIVAIALVSSSLAAKAINAENIAKFGASVGLLIKAYSDNAVGVFGIPKLMANVALVSSIATSTINIGKGISEFVKISDKPEVIDMAVTGVTNFVRSMLKVLTDPTLGVENLPDGALKVLGIGNLMKDVATGMVAMGNMEYYETALVNGKIVKVGQAKKFTQADFDRVGASLSTMITAVSKPLGAIGAEDGWFSKGDTQKGIEALSKIGSIFTPITNIITAFKGGEKSISSGDVADVSKSIDILLMGISGTFQKLEDAGTLEYFSANSVMMTGLRDTLKYLSTMTGDGLSKVGIEIDKIFTTLGNQKPLQNIKNNLGNIRKEATLIRAEVNKFDLQRLTLFNQTTKNLLEAAKNGSMEQLIRAMNDLVNELRSSAATVSQTPAAPIMSLPYGQPNAAPTAPVIGGKPSTTTTGANNTNDNSNIQELFEILKSELKTLNSKIQNPMLVKMVAGQPSF